MSLFETNSLNQNQVMQQNKQYITSIKAVMQASQWHAESGWGG